MVRRQTIAWVIGGFLALHAISCDDGSGGDYRRAVEEARRCVAGDVCVVVGYDAPCTCPEPVNATHADQIEAMAMALECDYDIGCLLPVQDDPRCQEGLCVW
jgi:hypothetical protein